jgi:hypothetical protein
MQLRFTKFIPLKKKLSTTWRLEQSRIIYAMFPRFMDSGRLCAPSGKIQIVGSNLLLSWRVNCSKPPKLHLEWLKHVTD